MKLSFALSALAVGMMNVASVMADSASISIPVEFAIPAGEAVPTQGDLAGTAGDVAEVIVEEGATGGSRRKLEGQKDRQLQTIEVVYAEGIYTACVELNPEEGVSSVPNPDGPVEICASLGLEGFFQGGGLQPCPTGPIKPPSPTPVWPYNEGDMCTLLTFNYVGIVTISGGEFTVTYSQAVLDILYPELQTRIEADLAGKAVGTVKVDDVFLGPVGIVSQGDPHFKTWGGKWFDFMGECDLKMVHAPHFDGEDKPLDIDVRTKIRYDYSYIESAALKLGNDTLEVASFGDYFLNGVEGAAMPAFVGGYPVTHSNPSKKVHVFEIALDDKEKITIKTFKDLVAVMVEDVEPKRFHGALGMGGSFDKFGKMLGRDGVTEIEDPTAFANEWQIRQDETSLFHVAKGPQHPEQCKLPEISTSDKRRRLGEGLAREKAERACAHFSGEQFENCVFDVMAVGDIEIAQAGAY